MMLANSRTEPLLKNPTGDPLLAPLLRPAVRANVVVNGHVLRMEHECEKDHYDYNSCPVCHWGLGICKNCNAAEIELEVACTKVPQPMDPSHDPVCREADGWVFYAEDWATRHGPYLSESEARARCAAYGRWLNGEITNEEIPL